MNLNNNKLIIGTMTGISLDGLDLVLVSFFKDKKGNVKYNELKFNEYEYPSILKKRIIKAMDEDVPARFLTSLNFEIAKFYSEKINEFISESGYSNDDIYAIGSHGQTIYHLIDPEGSEMKSTMQLGDGSYIAQNTGINTVTDFRVADMAAGGEGAPLVSYMDHILFSIIGKKRILQNIGGISNSTLVTGDINEIILFDNGPGNMIMNRVCEKLFNIPYDKDGLFAKKGKVDQDLLNELLDNDYFKLKPPKSTGREMFGNQFTDELIYKHPNIDKHDLLRTVTEFTVQTIYDSYINFLIKDNSNYEVIISGGGSYNPHIRKGLENKLGDKIKVLILEDLGMNSSSKEAVAFAFFALNTLEKHHSNIPIMNPQNRKVILGKVSYYK